MLNESTLNMSLINSFLKNQRNIFKLDIMSHQNKINKFEVNI